MGRKNQGQVTRRGRRPQRSKIIRGLSAMERETFLIVVNDRVVS